MNLNCTSDPNAYPTNSKVVVSLGIHRTDGGLAFKLDPYIDVSFECLCVCILYVDGLATECTSARLTLPATMLAKVFFVCVCLCSHVVLCVCNVCF